MVTPFDGPMLYQHHLAKFRILDGAPIGPHFLLAALESSFGQRQIRAMQFSADIIDSVVGRLGEVAVAVPKDGRRLSEIESSVTGAVLARAKAREKLSYIFRELDPWLRSESESRLNKLFEWEPSAEVYRGRPAFLGGRAGFVAFAKHSGELLGDILLPKYYDPFAADLAAAYSRRCRLVDVGTLVEEGALALSTGDEVGKMSYGTGTIPFLRTSDFGSYELKRNPKQGVGREIWMEWQEGQDVVAGDIFLVRDGTYLVGSSAMVAQDDLPLLYCGGIFKIRCTSRGGISPGLLYAVLNTPFVRRQMRNKQFTRDVIDTLGRRFLEVLLPVPKEKSERDRITHGVETLLSERTHARGIIDRAISSLYPNG
jgi:hypothetical protein